MGMASSEEYVRTSRQVIFSIQKSVNEVLVTGRPSEYLEDESIEALVTTATSMGMNAGRIRKRHVVMQDLTGKHCLGGIFPTLTLPADDWALVEDFVEDGREELTLKAIQHTADEEKVLKTQMNCKYFITVTRRTGFRRLHLNGCFVQPDKCREVHYLDIVDLNDFDSICKTCKRKMTTKSKVSEFDDSSSTPSSSSTGGSEDDSLKPMG